MQSSHFCARRKLPTYATIFLCFTILIGSSQRQAQARSASEAIQPPSAEPPIVVLGLDGLTFDVLDPMLNKGELPNLALLLRRGARARLISEKPMRSPALWTTIATGRHRDVHQIYDFVTGSAYWPRELRSSGQKLVTSKMRQAPAIWNRIGQQDRSSWVVGWLNSWPAEPVQGVMVAPYVALGKNKQTSIKGKIYRNTDNQVWPSHRAQEIHKHIVQPGKVDAKTLATLAQPPPSNSSLYKDIPRLKRYMYTMRWSLASAQTNIRILEHLWQQGDRPNLIMTYLDGADTLGHRFWLFRQPLRQIKARLAAHNLPTRHARELKRRFGKVIEGYMRFTDRLLGRLIQRFPQNTTWMLVSDHGWGDLRGKVRAPHDHVPFEGEHRLDGVLILSGPQIAPGYLADKTLYDIAPTLHYLLGTPIPEDLPGKVMGDAIRPNFLAANPKKRMPVAALTHQAPSQPNHAPKSPTGNAPQNNQVPFADTELERLRSLGYVQ